MESHPCLTATVIYDYVWTADDGSKQTLAYTTTYIDSPGNHTAYALVVNTALPSSLQVETVGFPYTISPGDTTTQHASATVATHRPTRLVLQTDHARTPSATISSVWISSPNTPYHGVSSSPVLSLYLPYLQVILACLFFGGYFWFCCLRHLRSQDDGLERGRSTVLSLEKLASDKTVGLDESKSQN